MSGREECFTATLCAGSDCGPTETLLPTHHCRPSAFDTTLFGGGLRERGIDDGIERQILAKARAC